MGFDLGDIVGGAEVIGGGIASLYGAPEFGVPLMMGGATTIGQSLTNNTNQQIASNATSTNLQSANNANALSLQELGMQEQYETQMSNTGYQRSVADMQAAGLNPVLAGMNTSPATTPSVSAAAPKQATAQSTSIDNAIGSGMSSASQTGQAIAAIQSQKSQAALNSALALKAATDTDTSKTSARQMSVETQAKESQLSALAAEAEARRRKAQYDAKAATYDAIMSRANRDTGTAKNMVDMLGNVLNFGPKSPTGRPGFGTLKDGTNFNLDTGEVQP